MLFWPESSFHSETEASFPLVWAPPPPTPTHGHAKSSQLRCEWKAASGEGSGGTWPRLSCCPSGRMLLKIRREAALFKKQEKRLHPHLKEPKWAEEDENVLLILHRLIKDPPSLATLATPGVNRHLEGERRRGAQAGDYIMAAES